MTRGIRYDLKGKKFGSLLVIDKAARLPGNLNSQWVCRCDCGKEVVVQGSRLKAKPGQNKDNCGCKSFAKMSAAHSTHKMTGTPTYTTWVSMVDRCSNASRTVNARYAGRGISVCLRWRESFEAFLEDMGERPPGMTIDRIDVNGNYEPRNCRWADNKTQNRNKSTAHYVEIDGVTKCVTDWSEESGVNRETLYDRIRRGVTGVDLLKPAPPRRKRQ